MILVCLMGRSGSGKSLIEKLISELGYKRSISYTTRKPEDGEVSGIDYHFVTKENFFKLIDRNILMEWAEYNGNLYGSPHPIGATNYVAVVEPDGYREIKKTYGSQVVGVYIDVETELAEERARERNRKKGRELMDDIRNRKVIDDIKFSGIERQVDMVVDGRKEPQEIVVDILKNIK